MKGTKSMNMKTKLKTNKSYLNKSNNTSNSSRKMLKFKEKKYLFNESET